MHQQAAGAIPSRRDPLLDEAGRVAISLQCVKCGYNLRTLASNGVCPECATPVAHAVAAIPIVTVPATWLNTISRGASLMWCAATLILAAPLVGAMFGLAYALGMPWAEGAFAALAPLVAAWFALHFGAWAMAAPLASCAELCEDPARRRVRGLIVVSCAVTVSLIAWGSLNPNGLFAAATGAWWIMTAWVWRAGMQQAIRARRVWNRQDAPLANTTASLLLVSIIFSTLGLIVPAGALLVTEADPRALFPEMTWILPAMIGYFLGGVFFVVAMIVAVGALNSYSGELKPLVSVMQLRDQHDR